MTESSHEPTTLSTWEQLAAVAGLEPLLDASVASKLIPAKLDTFLRWLNRCGFPRRYRLSGRHRPRRIRMVTPNEIRKAREHFIRGDKALLTHDLNEVQQ